MAQRLDRQLGPVILAGYDAYRKEFAHAPETLFPQPAEIRDRRAGWRPGHRPVASNLF